jgi:hypothetical protein
MKRVALILVLCGTSVFVRAQTGGYRCFGRDFTEAELRQCYEALRCDYVVADFRLLRVDGKPFCKLSGTVKAYLDGQPMLLDTTNGFGIVAVNAPGGNRLTTGDPLTVIGKPAGVFDGYYVAEKQTPLVRYESVPGLTYDQFMTALRNTAGTAFPEMRKAAETRKPAVDPAPPQPPVPQPPDKERPKPTGVYTKGIPGQFYVTVNDAAVIYVNGKQVHSAPKGDSVSSELALNLGDLVAVELDSGKGLGSLRMGFLAKDHRLTINFRQQDFRDMGAQPAADVTAAAVEGATLRIQKCTHRRDKLAYPEKITDHSEWVWSKQKQGTIATIIKTPMLDAQ